ncbi:uncharacterized protein V6R79_024576 [Siganus canaliculatus]
MKLLLLLLLRVLCLCLLSVSGSTSAASNGEVQVDEGSDVVLLCSLGQTDLNYQLFDWKKDDQQEVFMYDAGIHYNNGQGGQDPQFKGRVSHFHHELKHGNASIKIRNTKVQDSGDYSCIFPRLQHQIFHIKLVVGASPRPFVTSVNYTKDWSLLQCEVLAASPKPTVEWRDSSGNVVPAKEPQVTERGGSYDIILQTTVTKTDRYRCVSTQDEIKHQVYADIHIYIGGASSEPYVSTLHQTKDQALLQCVVRGASPKPTVEWRDSSGNIVPAKEPQVTERGGSYDIILQTTVTKTDRYRCVSTQDEIKHQVHAETEVYISVEEMDQDLLHWTKVWKDLGPVLVPVLDPVVVDLRSGRKASVTETSETSVNWEEEPPLHRLLRASSAVPESSFALIGGSLTSHDFSSGTESVKELRRSHMKLLFKLLTGFQTLHIRSEAASGDNSNTWKIVAAVLAVVVFLLVGCLCYKHCKKPKRNEGEVQVDEGSDVVLLCSLRQTDLTYEVFDWQKDDQKEVFFYDAGVHYNNSRVSHFHHELKHGNASIKIRNTKVQDSGDYSCIFRHLQHQIFHIKLVVGASSKPSVTTLDQTKDQALLQCEVLGASPKPTVEWRDSSGNVVPAKEPQVTERGGSYDIILQTTVTKTDHYRCVSTQDEINHQVYVETEVYITLAGPRPHKLTGDSTGWIVAAVVSVLFIAVVVGFIVYIKYSRRQRSGGEVQVDEGSDVVLLCSLGQTDLNYELFDWKKDDQKEVFLYDAGIHYNSGRGGQDPQFKGRVSHFHHELKHGNASIKIRNTKVQDSGDYSCIFPRLDEKGEHTCHIKLVVGASPEPYVTSVSETKDWSLLQCVVRGASPKPTVEWRDSSGNIVPAKEPQVTERGGSYDIILQTTVTKTDRYRCVSTQDEIKHQVHAETEVYISGASSKPVVAILDQTKDWSLLQCEVLGASPKPTVEWRDSSGNVVPAKEPQVTERGGSYDIILQTTVTKTDRYRCVSTQDEIKHQVHAETYVSLNVEEMDQDLLHWTKVWKDLGPVLVPVLDPVVVDLRSGRKASVTETSETSVNWEEEPPLHRLLRASSAVPESSFALIGGSLTSHDFSSGTESVKELRRSHMKLLFKFLTGFQTLHIRSEAASGPDSQSGDNTGWIAGFVVLCIVVIALAGFIIYTKCCKKEERKEGYNRPPS